ncbi:MAG: histidine kinase dimerization/phospho-acceptor domain-containing protein [Formivibrio sp.]|nr:histidine kinase dimerization/phospho-acceptor domain-containing protein [Formivibrio sp.]
MSGIAFRQFYAIFLNDDTQRLRLAGKLELPPGVNFESAKATRDAGQTTVRQNGEYSTTYFPLHAISSGHGVIAISCNLREPDLLEKQRFEMLASLVAVTIERIRFAELAKNATLKAEAEQLRSSILSALSHDIRTPLTTVIGLSEALAASQPPLTGIQFEMAHELNELSSQMSDLVSNLLDMARLQSGRLRLRREWQPIEDVIGTSLRQIRRRYPGRAIRVSVPTDFPLIEFDTVLIERVLCNLLENAIKFSPDGEILLLVSEGAFFATVGSSQFNHVLHGTSHKDAEFSNPGITVRGNSRTLMASNFQPWMAYGSKTNGRSGKGRPLLFAGRKSACGQVQ